MPEHAEPIENVTSAWTPASVADLEAVRGQAGRVASSAMFKNSKRFPAFVQYTVEHALTSREPLKERTIGHEVFGRDADYDTSQDPIVRMTAAEVRKRLTQYYASPEHHDELVIGYQPGSYVPEFFRRAPLPTAGDAPPAEITANRDRRQLIPWLVTAVAVATMSAVLLFQGRATPQQHESTPDPASRFWAPILASSAPVLICIGDPVSDPPQPGSANVSDSESRTIEEFLRSNSVRYTEATTLALLAGELRARGKSFRIRRQAAAELKDLRDGPAILIGGFNNPWVERLSPSWRFTLASDQRGPYVRDAERPDDRRWRRDGAIKFMKDIRETYGLLTRVQDPSTGQSVLSVSGLALGTGAAAECLLDSTCMQTAESRGADFARTNVQVVVGAAVIGEDAGAPQVLATHSW